MKNRNRDLPLVAILRGVLPTEIDAIAGALFDAGFRYIEVPLNSPDAFASIARLVDRYGAEAACGAGTVTQLDQVAQLHATGARLMVTPNCNVDIIRAGLDCGMTVVPGVLTPTEAFAAIGAGTTQIKLFPVADLGAAYVKNLRAVLPGAIQLFAVGGVHLGNMAALRAAGADGFGLGGDLYRPGDTAPMVSARAREFIALARQLF